MNFIQVCANQFDDSLRRAGVNRSQMDDARKAAFNVCTVALITVIALGILGSLSLTATAVLGASALFGRVVANYSLQTEIRAHSVRATVAFPSNYAPNFVLVY